MVRTAATARTPARKPVSPVAARAAARRQAELEAEQGEAIDVEEAENEAPALASAGIGISAARRAQGSKPGQLIGHTKSGRVIVIGRDGKPISRIGESGGADPYDIPKNEIPAGWSYQWCAETVYNAPQSAAMMDFKQKQWTPVPQDRHPTIPVRQGGLILMERPSLLTQEARNEEIAKAKLQLRTNIEQFQPNANDGLKATGGIRKGRGQPVDADGVVPPTLEVE